jgi:hypothetical protein
MRYSIILSSLLLGAAVPANAQITITFGVPSQSIGINMPVYPEFQRVPDYPVYYAPRVGFNLFFYDGMYWAYQGDQWYASSWYNGPWGWVAPQVVPLYVLRVPVRYYRSPPSYFRGWQPEAPPRWGEHWGPAWERERNGWDRWDRHAAPAPAPRPSYQRQYSAERYPQFGQQQELRSQNYRYQPRDEVVRDHYRSVEPQTGRGPPDGHGRQQPSQPIGAPVPQPGPPPRAEATQRPPPAVHQPPADAPRRDAQDRASTHEPQPRPQTGKDHDKNDERGPDSKK